MTTKNPARASSWIRVINWLVYNSAGNESLWASRDDFLVAYPEFKGQFHCPQTLAAHANSQELKMRLRAIRSELVAEFDVPADG